MKKLTVNLAKLLVVASFISAAAVYANAKSAGDVVFDNDYYYVAPGTVIAANSEAGDKSL